MSKKTTSKSNIIRAFFKDCYSVQTISAFNKIDVLKVEDVIRAWARRQKGKKK